MPELATVEIDRYTELAVLWATNLAWAAVILTAGWVFAGWGERGLTRMLGKVRGCDDMLRGFLASLAKWGILVVAGIAALDRMGVYTTSIVAVLGAAGLAVGLALQGTLSNLAAGVMLLLFRPFRAGDSIEAGGIAGTVLEVSLVHTVLKTGDNVQITAPNAMLWSGAVRNLSVHPTRVAEVVVPVPYGQNPQAAMEKLRAIVVADPRVAAQPAPSVTVVRLGEKAAEVSVKAWCEAGQVGALKADIAEAAWRALLDAPVG